MKDGKWKIVQYSCGPETANKSFGLKRLSAHSLSFRLWNWSNSYLIIPVSTERLGKVHSPGQTVRGAGMKMGSLLRGRAALLPLFAHGPQAHLAFVEICGQM